MVRKLFTILTCILLCHAMSAQDTADTTLMRYLRNEGLISYPARGIRIYTNAHDKLVDLFQDIDNAKRKVWIEYLIIANDSIGKLTMQHLEEAAK